MEDDTTAETSGWQVLNEARDFITRFCVLPSQAHADMLALWAAHTHAYKAFPTSPRLAILSDQPASGKTRVLTMVGLLSARPKNMSSFTAAVLARMAAKGYTICLDETDTIFRTSQSAAAIQAILNDGWQATGTAFKAAGSADVEEQCVYSPVALAGLRRLPPATMSRSIVVTMRPRKPEEHIDSYMSRMHEPWGASIGDALGSWTKSRALELGEAWPDMPDGIEDRTADAWWPLLAVADVAGGDWPDRARAACMELTKGVAAEPEIPPLVRLLRDIRTVWTGDRLASSVLIGRLMELPGAPWASRWAPLAASRELAAMLRGAEVAPRKMRISGQPPVQGYDKRDFERAWSAAVPAPQQDHVPAEQPV